MKTKAPLVATCAALFLSGCMGNGELVRPGKPAGMLNLVNGSDSTLTVVTISECSAASHGFSRLETDETIRPGASRRWAVSEGCYDVQAGFPTSNGHSSSDSRIQIGAERVYNLTVN